MNKHKHKQDHAARARRNDVRTVECPECGAPPYDYCYSVRRGEVGFNQRRAASHAGRWAVWRYVRYNAVDFQDNA